MGYVASDVSNPTRRARYLKNRIKTDLTTISYSDANSIFVSNDNIYVAGKHYDGNYRACYWKNNNRVDLSTISSTAYSIFVLNNDVYVAGVEDNRASLWKNNTQINLEIPEGTTSSSATSAYVASSL